MLARIACLALGFSLFPVAAFADDIRSDSVVDGIGSSAIPYVATLSECDTITAVTTADGLSPSIERPSEAGSQCYVRFSLTGANRLSPRLTVARLGGAEDVIEETFPVADLTAPTLTIVDVAIVGNVDDQRLTLTLEASDTVDLRYLAVSMTGLRASVLRAHGGIVSDAVTDSFARADSLRVYPVNEGQTEFQVAVPVAVGLSGEVIAADAMALIDVLAVDAFGNRTSVSDIRFIGGNISEAVKGLRVLPDRVVITSPLQKPAIIPVVDFQFRGEVALPGSGAGVTYESSHPELIGVSAAGLVYALQETEGAEVFINVNYPGAEAVSIPVRADFGVTVDRLELEGVSESSPLVLERLNRYLELPPLIAVLSDGERVPIPENWKRNLEVLSVASLLQSDKAGRLRAGGVIPEIEPAMVRLNLTEVAVNPLEFPVAAQDAPPDVSLDIEGAAIVGSDYQLFARASDDVGVSRVDFIVDGTPISSSVKPPYGVILPISEQMLGKTLSLVALATDTFGNTSQSPEKKVTVGTKSNVLQIGEISVVSPSDGQRVVEGVPLVVQIEKNMGGNPSAINLDLRNILFYLDAKEVGQASAPIVEERPSETGEGTDYIFIWRARLMLPQVSTGETSVALGIKLIGSGDRQKDLPTRLIRVVANQPPSALIKSPVEGAAVTAGDTVDVEVAYSDDTGGFGARVELLDGSDVIGLIEGGKKELPERDVLNPSVEEAVFSVPTSEEDIGTVLSLRARITDFHGKSYTTEPRDLSIVADQPPSIAISHPVEGSSYIAGMPINLRASASDDVKVKRVDFYVDGRLSSSDYSAPFSIQHNTESLTGEERRLTITAEAFDSADQRAEAAPVTVVLGHDEVAPVLNLASPSITETEAGLDLAPVLEREPFVLKFTGFDNLGATRIEVEGIARANGNSGVWQLTGQPTDVATEAQLPLLSIPGALNAYSALALIEAPAFSHTENVDQDLYRITARIFDERGNKSEMTFAVAVRADAPPEVTRLDVDQPAYQLRDTLRISVLAEDDKAISQLHYRLYQGESLLHESQKSEPVDFFGLKSVQSSLSLPVSDLGIANQDASIRIDVTATDDRGVLSDVKSLQVPINADDEGPSFSFVTPAESARLLAGSSQQFNYRVVDKSHLASLSISTQQGVQVHQSPLSGKEQTGSFS